MCRRQGKFAVNDTTKLPKHILSVFRTALGSPFCLKVLLNICSLLKNWAQKLPASNGARNGAVMLPERQHASHALPGAAANMLPCSVDPSPVAVSAHGVASTAGASSIGQQAGSLHQQAHHQQQYVLQQPVYAAGQHQWQSVTYPQQENWQPTHLQQQPLHLMQPQQQQQQASTAAYMPPFPASMPPDPADMRMQLAHGSGPSLQQQQHVVMLQQHQVALAMTAVHKQQQHLAAATVQLQQDMTNLKRQQDFIGDYRQQQLQMHMQDAEGTASAGMGMPAGHTAHASMIHTNMAAGQSQ